MSVAWQQSTHGVPRRQEGVNRTLVTMFVVTTVFGSSLQRHMAHALGNGRDPARVQPFGDGDRAVELDPGAPGAIRGSWLPTG